MNKIDREHMFELFDKGLNNSQVAEQLGVARRTVIRAKQEYEHVNNFSTEDRQATTEFNDGTKMQTAINNCGKLEPMVLNAIYRCEKWQTVFFQDDKLFCRDNKIHRTVFEFLKWAYKHVGYMPSQERITLMFDECLHKNKTLSQEEIVNVSDMFDKVIWSLDEDVDYLSDVCERYRCFQETAEFIDKARMYLIEDLPLGELKDAVMQYGKKIDVDEDNVFDMCDDISGTTSKFYPFFVRAINDKIHGLATGNNILCGCTGSGKTMACISQEVYLAKQQIASLHFILGDLTALEYQCRVLSHLSQTEYYKIISDGNLQMKLKAQYKDILKYIKVYAAVESKTIDAYLHIVDKIRKRCASDRQPVPSFVVFDYDDLIDTRASDEWKRAEEIYLATQHHGMKNDICYLLVAQPTKEAEMNIRQGNRKMLLTDISGGRKKANIVANAIGFSVGKRDDTTGMTPVEISVMKGRNGGLGTSVDVLFDGNRCSYIHELESDEQAAQREFQGFEHEPLPFG